jgi:hypothetical protein
MRMKRLRRHKKKNSYIRTIGIAGSLCLIMAAEVRAIPTYSRLSHEATVSISVSTSSCGKASSGTVTNDIYRNYSHTSSPVRSTISLNVYGGSDQSGDPPGGIVAVRSTVTRDVYSASKESSREEGSYCLEPKNKPDKPDKLNQQRNGRGNIR